MNHAQISSDPSWQELRDLAFLRHKIIHKSGIIGSDDCNKKRFKDIVARVPKASILLESYDESTIRLELDVCRYYLGHVRQFFDRIFENAGMEGIKKSPPNSSTPSPL